MNSPNSIINSIRSKRELLEYKKLEIEKLKNKKNTLRQKIETLKKSKEAKENLILTCKLILEKITYASKAKLENFLTKSVNSVFLDRNYTVKLILKEDTKKPGLELTLSEDGVDQEITDSVGGGIISTLGLLLQIYYIEVYDLNKVLFIDEGLKEISTGINSEGESVNYLENLLSYLKWLADEKKYSLVIITHDNTVKKFSDKVYTVKKGEVKLCS